MPQRQMKSINFEFLRATRPQLADLAAFAEEYVHPDPASAVVKLRTFAEQATLSLYQTMGIPVPDDNSFFNLLTADPFKKAVPRPVLDILHLIRTTGNRGAHGKPVQTSDLIPILQDSHKFAQWIYLSHDGGDGSKLTAFQIPPSGGFSALAEKEKEREREKILRRLAEKEAETQRLLEELEVARSKVAAAEKSEEELAALKEKGRSTLDYLKFDEASTRKRLIDGMLRKSGWDVGDDCRCTEEVGQEVEIHHQPTASGKGYADYVLYDDNGKPLAVVEAKKTAHDAGKGRTQAKCYADGLEKQSGQRPIVFYTNGFELWIENDKDGEPPRRLYDYYAKASLKAIFARRSLAIPPDSIAHNPDIVNRLYQLEALKRVTEDLRAKRRKALIVMATGTGKTRVAVALCDILSRANIAQRVLFLCDRLELRKQAHGAFKEFLPGQPRTFVTARTAEDRNQRIYLGTYPAMMRCYQSFDPGFFDLVIADESHRSIYNRYRMLLIYFDALMVGLTATPVEMVARNTFKLFERPDKDPTANYDLKTAIEEGHLVPFRVYTHTTQFLRDGIKYAELTEAQRKVVEEQEKEPEIFRVSAGQLDKVVFNKDTNRVILRNLMEKGIRDSTGTRPGKSIIFARNHNHAVLMEKLFSEMYPQYGGDFCRVIDNYDPRADKLIDDFKDQEKKLTIAISVDMLDTGIDVPEVVNLVFAKPVFSKVKFWQMIGRGTRLCPDLFGMGKHKSEFFIFDHWGTSGISTSMATRTGMSTDRSPCLSSSSRRALNWSRWLSRRWIARFRKRQSICSSRIFGICRRTRSDPREYRQVKSAENREALLQFTEATTKLLLVDVAPLMQWRDATGESDAYRFDLLVTRIQLELLKKSASFDGLRDEVINQVNALRKNLNQVQARAATIKRVNAPDHPFWNEPTHSGLEEMRVQLRGIMQYRQKDVRLPAEPRIYDIPENLDLVAEEEYQPRALEGMDMIQYRNRVEAVLRRLEAENPTLLKIKRGQSVSEKDLDDLVKLVLVQDSMVDLRLLREFFPDTAGHLDFAIRRIIGMEAQAVDKVFADFVKRYSAGLSAPQIQFLNLIKNHIRKYGTIQLEELYDAPFTTLHADSVDGVFKDDQQVDFLLNVLDRFKPTQGPQSHA
jgi:type I restriction enzyme R subunit